MPRTSWRNRPRGSYRVEKKDTVILLRLTREEKAAFTAMARRHHETLSAWLRRRAVEALDEATYIRLDKARRAKKGGV